MSHTNPLPERLRASADEVQSFPHPSFCDHLHVAHDVMREAAAALEAYDLGARSTAAQPVEPTYEPIVEVWHGGRKVTVYPPRTVLRVWGTNMATEMSNEPFNLKTVQQAMDWLYSAPPAASGDSTPPSASVQGDSTERSGYRPEAVDRERGAR